jgi:hypothetical protein
MGANTLDVFKKATITALKSVIVQAPFMANGASTMVKHLNTDLEVWVSSLPVVLQRR